MLNKVPATHKSEATVITRVPNPSISAYHSLSWQEICSASIVELQPHQLAIGHKPKQLSFSSPTSDSVLQGAALGASHMTFLAGNGKTAKPARGAQLTATIHKSGSRIFSSLLLSSRTGVHTFDEIHEVSTPSNLVGDRSVLP